MDIEELEERQVLQVMCKDELLFYTQYTFKKRHGKKFVTNTHHKQISEFLEKVITGEITRGIINIAPRYTKTELAVKHFISHCLSINSSARFLHLSYSQELALDNSEEIRDIIKSDAYQELFPDVKIKPGSTAKKKWFTTKGGGVYATAAGGQVTGFGAGEVDQEEDDDEIIDEFFTEGKDEFAGAIIIDDPIKPEDADNVIARDKINKKFDSTIRSRANSRKTPIIIIMQRLHPNDLCSHVQKYEEWEVLSLPCLIEEDGIQKALWEHKDTVEELLKKRKIDSITFERQYQQNPKPLEGLLYKQYLTYDQIDFPIDEKKSYTDGADTGKDNLCSIQYVPYMGLKYLTDVYYTQESAETTEPELAKRHQEEGVNYAKIESNAGGRALCRNVERITREEGNYKTMFQPFHQSGNKVSRIINGASTVQNVIRYPADWAHRWPKFYDSMTSFMKKTCQDHEGMDDAQDCITGVVEDEGNDVVVTISS